MSELRDRVDAIAYRRITGSCHSMPSSSERSVDDAVKAAEQRAKDLPHVVQVYPRDWDTCILARELEARDRDLRATQAKLADREEFIEGLHDQLRKANIDVVDLKAKLEAAEREERRWQKNYEFASENLRVTNAALVAAEPERRELKAKLLEAESAPARAQGDARRLEYLLWKLPGDALRHVCAELSDTSDMDEFRAALDQRIAALAAPEAKG